MRISLVRFPFFFSLLFIFLLVSSSSAQAQGEVGFRTTYSSAISFTPVSSQIRLFPAGEFDVTLSLSGELTVMTSHDFGLALAGGFYPYTSHDELIVSAGFRTFTGETAPVGTYLELSAIGGVARDSSLGSPFDPLFGVGARVGSIRTTRFGSDLGFTYGAGGDLVFERGRPEIRAVAFFGISYLFGKSTIVRQ